MPNKNLRIFIGPSDIANVGAILASALREKEIRVTVTTRGMSPLRAGMEYDILLDSYSLNQLRKILTGGYHSLESSLQHNAFIFRLGRRLLPILKLLGEKTIKLCGIFKECYYFPWFFLRHDTFIFLGGRSLLPYNLDLLILKLFHKKTVMWFLGSDIRHYESVEAAMKKMGIKYRQSEASKRGPEVLKQRLRMIHRVEKYVDYIISHPIISHLLTRKYHTIFIPLDIDNIRYNNVPNPRPLVVHAPSKEELKGTSHILEAVEQLKKEGYDFEFCLFRNMSNVKVRETLSQADIAVDQLFATAGGMFALESMAAGCAVLGGNIPEFSGYSKELPIIHSDTDNIYQNLKLLLENPELRRELGEKGRRYVEKYHDHRKIADDFLRLIAASKIKINYPAGQDVET